MLAAKIFLSPICVVAVSLAGRRWGWAVAGILAGLPVVAGPILLVETLVHGRAFGSEAAAATLLGPIAVTVFVVVYGRLALVAGPARCLLLGGVAFAAGILALSAVRPPSAVSLVLVAACFAAGLSLLPIGFDPAAPGGSPPSWDLPARALTVLVLVLALTAVSGALGPHLSGLLAAFPVLTSVLAVFTHAHDGVGQLEVMLRNFLVGFYGFAAFFFTLAVSLSSLGTEAAFATATGVALLTQALINVGRSRMRLASKNI